MIQAVEKAPICKRMADPDACNPKCAMGYILAEERTLSEMPKQCFHVFGLPCKYQSVYPDIGIKGSRSMGTEA